MRKLFIIGLVIFGLWVIADRLLNDNWWNYHLYGGSIEARTYSEAQVNQADARKTNAEAQQIEEGIRRQREQDNGLSINMIARILTGNGITDFEKSASNLSQCLLWVVIFGVAFALLLARRKKA